MIKTLTIALIIAGLIIFFLILGLIGQLDDLCGYEKKIKRAREYIKHAQTYGTTAQVMPHLSPYVNGDDLLEILGDDNDK